MKVEILNKEVHAPRKGSLLSAGIDVHSPIRFAIPKYTTIRIPLGIAIELNPDEVGTMSERSSMGKKGITSVGNVIDADYRGEISIMLQNNSNESVEFQQNDRIGQIVICKLGDNSVEVVDKLSDTERGEGGFGSTGK